MSEPRTRGQTITVAQAAALLGRSDRWVQGLVKAGYWEGGAVLAAIAFKPALM